MRNKSQGLKGVFKVVVHKREKCLKLREKRVFLWSTGEESDNGRVHCNRFVKGSLPIVYGSFTLSH